jgi:F-type H+-transporting ATPase subunit b
MSRGWLLGWVLVLILAVFSPAGIAWAAAPGGETAHEAGAHGDDIFKGGAEITIWTLVVFGLLLFILGKYAWPQIASGLDQREKTIAQALEEARKAQEEARHLRADLQQQREAAARAAALVVEEARRNAQQMVEDIKAQGRAEIQADRARMNRELEMKHDQALADLVQHASQLATLVAAKAISRELTGDDHRRLVDEALAEMGSAAKERQRVLTGLA